MFHSRPQQLRCVVRVPRTRSPSGALTHKKTWPYGLVLWHITSGCRGLKEEQRRWEGNFACFPGDAGHGKWVVWLSGRLMAPDRTQLTH